MAPRAKTAPRAGADDSEDDLATTAVYSTATANKRATTTKMPKAKATTTRRVSAGKPAAKRKAAPKQSRQALKDRTNIPDGNETEEVDAFEDDEVAETTKPKAKRAKTSAATRKNARTRAAMEPAEEASAKPKAAPKRGRPAKHVPSLEPLLTIPETQPDPDMMEDVEQSIEVDPDDMDVTKEPLPKKLVRAPSVPVQSLQPLQPRPSARSGSAQPAYARPRERSGSVSGGDRRATDPELRRQLNEMTRKYEDLTIKYESLQEVGQGQAESNFERLRKASDQKAKDANELIASLKKELLELKKTSSTTASETTGLQKQVSALTSTNEKLTAERDDLKSKLQVSLNEVKSLEAKLIAARQQLSNSAQEAKAQETAAKKLNSGVPANNSDAQKEAKMKENLYSDLTGLIVRGVKRKEGEDEYDCIQTGRNGTLHFHLSIANDATTPHPKTPSGLSYEAAEFAYEPLLDESRDKELLDLLPDYLVEEICFPRNHAQKFYSKVLDSMTKKIVVDDG